MMSERFGGRRNGVDGVAMRGKWRILYVYNEYTGGITVYHGCLMGVEHDDDRA